MSDYRLPIIAIATANGRGAISVVRISGPRLGPFIMALVKRPLIDRHAHYLPIFGTDGAAIDQVIAIYFQAPHSFTGEDVLEIQCHGGQAVVRQIVQHCLLIGQAFNLQLARPGEFTERAFLNNKIDLIQAEAVSDLIDASSESAAPEEEIDFLEKYQARTKLNLIDEQLASILSRCKQGLVLRDGLHVVLAGAPNAGKSSLLNTLAGDDVSIVTDIAGTTRDKITHLIQLDGIPITITDTAGLRDTHDQIESIGIERTWQAIEKADVVLHLVDALHPERLLDAEIDKRRSRSSTVLTVINKLDLVDSVDTGLHELAISVKTGQGVDGLKSQLLKLAGWQPSQETPWMARQRHIDALLKAAAHVAIATEHAALDDRVLDLFAEELRLAHEALGSITGKVTADDLLGEIFSHFCIGK